MCSLGTKGVPTEVIAACRGLRTYCVGQIQAAHVVVRVLDPALMRCAELIQQRTSLQRTPGFPIQGLGSGRYP